MNEQAIDRAWELLVIQLCNNRRRWLYANDPLWRLTKLKANHETRLRRRIT